MARVNSGVSPTFLADQHLIAEQVELLMIPGALKKRNWTFKSDIPKKLVLGKGHMTFWYNKLLYLHRRHEEVKKEVARRGFKVTDLSFDLDNYPRELLNDWRPTMEDSQLIRIRIAERIKAKNKIFWRYNGNYIDLPDLEHYINALITSPLHYV